MNIARASNNLLSNGTNDIHKARHRNSSTAKASRNFYLTRETEPSTPVLTDRASIA